MAKKIIGLSCSTKNGSCETLLRAAAKGAAEYGTAINERMNPVFGRNLNVLKKTRVGAIIGVGGSGYDGWASLNLLMTNIFVRNGDHGKGQRNVEGISINWQGYSTG